MQPDRILAHEGYNLRSTSKLSGRDDPWLPLWLEPEHELQRAYRKLRNQRVLPRKEFYESVFVLARLKDWLAGAPPVLYELGAGHGFVGMLAALMAPGRVREVVAVDRRKPESHEKLRELIALSSPWVKTRSRFLEAKLAHLPPLRRDAWAIAVHACGQLTDQVARASAEARIPFVVVPCCEARNCLPGWTDGDSTENLAERVNAARADRWRSWGYEIEERWLPHRVTARRRMLLCRPG